jgi:DNA-directed RNA polymerase specialized sigma24 family protein
MSERRERKRGLVADAATRLYQRGLTYREISLQMGITVAAARSHVRAGLGDAPAMVRHLRQIA